MEVGEEYMEVQEETAGYGSHATQAQSISTSCKAQIVLSASIFFTLM